MKNDKLDQLCINTIRTLSMDAVQAANSGHPGTPMAMAPVVYCLWQRFLRFDPQDPIWPNRDRFVLSVGHASMLLYSMLHLCGVKAVNPKYEILGELSVALDDIKRSPSRSGTQPRKRRFIIRTGFPALFGEGGGEDDYMGSAEQMKNDKLDQLCINTIRTLSMDAVQAANSGHPGTPMAMAPVVYCLWQRFLRFDPQDPIWPNRDRFVLSVGHASMLLYSMLHLCGVKAVNPKYEILGELSVALDDIKRFRQLDSRCAGHPEYRWTSGVETTTGPLGQGVATSVGIALAGRWMGEYFNRAEFEMFDYNVYALCGDGCMMEGISGEAASLAGHLRLSNLCWIYDNNKITIEGHTDLAFSEDVATRFMAYGWNVTRVGDANDLEMIERALRTFKSAIDRPTLIIVDSHIAYGSPHKQDTSAAHGEPLGEEEIRLTKRVYGWPEDAKFLVPDGVREHFQRGMGQRGRALREAWMERFNAYKAKHPELADHLYRMQTRQLPEGWDRDLPSFQPDAKGIAGREASGKVLNAIAQNVPWVMGGSAL